MLRTKIESHDVLPEERLTDHRADDNLQNEVSGNETNVGKDGCKKVVPI
jgi:hypothetical protein